MANFLIILAFVVSLSGAGLQVWVLRRLQRTEEALICVVRLIDLNHPGPLPRELVEFIATNPAGVHRG